MGQFSVSGNKLVPLGDEAGMVLKAHLLLEQSLWMFIGERIKDEKLIMELRSDNSHVRHGTGLIHLAQALAARDDLPINNGEKIWPALQQFNSLRNKLAHELEPDRKKIDKYMRAISRSLLGENTKDLFRDFYFAAMLLLGYLGIERKPGTYDDVE